MELLLARHGQTADNAQGLILGRRDPPLSPQGRAQAQRLATAAAAANIVALWVSPLRRARETAAAVTDATDVPATVLDDLIESDRGAWEGIPVQEIARSAPALFCAFEAAAPGFSFPGGESLAHQIERTSRALDVVAAGRRPALVVAHVGTIRAAMLAVGGHPPPERALPHGELVPVGWPAPTAGDGEAG